ncbi:ankyrin [Aspergillus egyptiacus]|nr:ankyrin [Aspergillus egyptiacus]
MALSILPAELIRHVITQASPPDQWGKYWPRTQSVDDVSAFLALRLVCKEFNNMVLDYFVNQRVLVEDFNSACLQRSDPPTPAAVRFCRRLVVRHVERSRAGFQVNEASREFAAGIVKIVDAAVGALLDDGGVDEVERARLRDTYTDGVVSAVIGFADISKALLQGVAGTENEASEETEDHGRETGEDGQAADDAWADPLTTALIAAGILGRVDDMKALISKGAKPETAEEDTGRWLGHVLHGAAIGGNLDAIRLICSHIHGQAPGIHIDCPHTGNTALHFAAQYGHSDAVRFFLDAEFMPDERNKRAQTPLFLAASAGRTDVVDILLELDYTRAEKKFFGSEASALSDEHLAMEDPVVDVDADDYRGRTPMGIAVQRGYLGVVERLMWRVDLDINRRDPEEYEMTYLMIAASQGHEAIFNHLLGHTDIQKRANDSSGHGILKHAAVGGNENIVLEVLSWGNVDVNQRGADDSTPVMWAALYGQESVVKLLIDHGAAVDLVSRQLHLRMMRFLGVLDEPDHSVLDDHLMGAMTGQVAVLVGSSALDAAAHSGHEGIMRLLLSQPGVEIDQRDMDDRTPFANAALTGHEGVLRLLLRQGDAVDTEAQDRDGCTPLMLAARSGNESVVRVLLQEARADSSRTDRKGRSALAHAAEKGHDGVAKILLSAIGSKRVIEEALDVAQTPTMHALLTSYLRGMPEEKK